MRRCRFCWAPFEPAKGAPRFYCCHEHRRADERHKANVAASRRRAIGKA